MYSRIGCICLTFPHCVFSNVSSNGLPERMQSHIGYICLTFPHCAFSNVFSNRFSEWMQNRTGCICLTFSHCVSSNVPSNCLPLRMIITQVAFVLLFSTVRFQMFPQTACTRAGIVTPSTLLYNILLLI